MIDRRTFMSLLAGTAAVPGITWGQTSSGKVVVYASVGPELTQYDVDVGKAAMWWMGMVRL